MSDESSLSLHINLEFLRKEAKSLLRQCRLQDAAALARIRAQLPRVTDIQLADVHQALAREHGFANWAELKRQVDPLRAPGSDGEELPSGFTKWRLGFSCTVHPETLSPLVRDREYRLNVTVQRRVAKDQEFTGYGDLYRRAIRIAETRCADATDGRHAWIIAHAWWSGDPSRAYLMPQGSAFRIACASITFGVIYSNGLTPKGEEPPDPAALRAAGGLTPEAFGAKTFNKAGRRLDEMYADFDYGDTSIVTLSYGEYVQTCEGIDFAPFVRRAEHCARLHYGKGVRILRREWWCVTNPNLVAVDIYFVPSDEN